MPMLSLEGLCKVDLSWLPIRGTVWIRAPSLLELMLASCRSTSLNKRFEEACEERFELD